MADEAEYSKEYSPSSEANSSLPSTETSRILWKPQVHHVHSNPPLDSILSQINPVHTILFFNIQFGIILPSAARSYKWSLSFSLLQLSNTHKISRHPFRKPRCRQDNTKINFRETEREVVGQDVLEYTPLLCKIIYY